mgnify:CR=1 FL=1
MNSNIEKDDRLDLEGILFESDGSFIPFTANHGNVDGEIAEYRNIYMEAERNYFEKLLSVPHIKETFKKLVIDNDSNDDLFQFAFSLQEAIENGNLETPEELKNMESMSSADRDNYHMKKLEEAEALMCIAFAAIRDKALVIQYLENERVSQL